MFEPLLSPNFIPNFEKILGAVLDICRYARMDAWTDARRRYYRTCGFQPGTKKVYSHTHHTDDDCKAPRGPNIPRG